MTNFLSEFIGTTILILLGNGVVANVVLNKTKGNNSGWLVITLGWAMALYVAVLVSSASGAHLNPAVSIAMVLHNKLAIAALPIYILAQCLGAALGATLVWLLHKDHFDATTDADAKLAVFSTGPAIPNTISNFCSEVIGTFILVYTILYFKDAQFAIGPLSALPVALVLLAIGLCLGGTTGYCLNPARDFMPRLMHFLLPIKNKRNSNWSYSWIPVLGPIVGGILAVLLFKIM